MSEKILIGFEEKLFQADTQKFERAKELHQGINLEFKKIDIPVEVARLLKADNIQDYIVNQYWNYAETLLPKGFTPLKALSSTDFDLKAVVSYVYELRALSNVFVIKGIDIVSKVDQENYNVYVSKDKENEFKTLNNIIENLLKINTAFGWQWNFQRAVGHERVSVINDIPTPNQYYFSN
jgi:hypothetical protein